MFVFAAVSGFLSVAFGAFAAHALKSSLSSSLLATFDTAVQYQMFHSLALLAIVAATKLWANEKLLVIAGSFFIVGILLFSGSLYALSLTGITGLGMITPIGGVCFLVGWTALTLFAIRKA